MSAETSVQVRDLAGDPAQPGRDLAHCLRRHLKSRHDAEDAPVGAGREVAQGIDATIPACSETDFLDTG